MYYDGKTYMQEDRMSSVCFMVNLDCSAQKLGPNGTVNYTACTDPNKDIRLLRIIFPNRGVLQVKNLTDGKSCSISHDGEARVGMDGGSSTRGCN
eukprot:UN02802